MTKSNQYEIQDSNILKGKGFMPYSDIEKLVVKYNQQKNITLVSSTIVTTATMAIATNLTTQQETENTLISLYQQSSKEQKKTFRRWLVEQELN